MFVTGLFLACSGPTPESTAPTEAAAPEAHAAFTPRTFALPDGTEVAVPGDRTVVIEVIRSADW